MSVSLRALLVTGLVGWYLSVTWPVTAADPPSTVGPLLGLLKKGTLPPERIPNVAKMVCERGNEHDLAYVFSEVTGTNWPMELRRDSLSWLREAAATRKVRPAGDLDGLSILIADSQSPEIQSDAVQLAALWKTPAAVESLRSLAANEHAAAALRDAAGDALIAYGGDVARQTIDQLLAAQQPLATRMRGAGALARIDQQQAAAAAAAVLQAATSMDDPAPLIDAFLQVKAGADSLAAALKTNPPSSEVALLALRHMYAVGRSDAALDSLLSELAGIKGEVPKLTEEQILQKAEQARSDGDAERGELVFRRADLACMRCHAVSKAGGQIGPDLSALGASSPVDYVVKSIYDPDAQKKEEYVTRILLTDAGQQLTGIIANRTEEKLTLKLADGKLIDVATADIDYEGVGKSLMPEGLVKFMTEQEILDLVKFLSTLGKPGTPYEIRQTQRMQRWRMLKSPPPRVLESVPDEELLGDLVLRSPAWAPVYARVNGELPIPEVVAATGNPVVFVQGEAVVTAAGTVQIDLDSDVGLQAWFDDSRIDLQSGIVSEVPVGRHSLTLRIDTGVRDSDSVTLTLTRPSGSGVQFTVVDGP